MLFNQAKKIYHQAVDNPVTSNWKRWGKFAWAIPFMATDIAISENKVAAVSANLADLSVAWALRKKKGIIPFVLPPLAYGATRAAVSLMTGRKTIESGTTLIHQVATDIITLGESNKAVVPIKGHDAGHWGREQIFANGDFQPGSSWKGLLNVLRRPLNSIKAWKLNRQLEVGAQAYESMVRYGLARQGVSPTSVKRLVNRATSRDLTGTIGIDVRGKSGEALVESWREFTPKSIDLENIRIHESLRGKGLGGFFRRGESAIFQRMGYSTKTVVTSPVVNPRTARMHLQLYGGKLEVTEQTGLYAELYNTKAPTNLTELTLQKKLTKKDYLEFGGATAIGRLPSSRALNKILGHDMRWGRSWVQRILGTDFKPGSSWIGIALNKGISFNKISEAAFRMGGPAAVARTTSLTAQKLTPMLETAFKSGGEIAVKKLINTEFKFVTEEGKRFLRGELLGKGTFKQAQTVYSLSPGAIEKSVLAEALPTQSGSVKMSSGQIGGMPVVLMRNQTKFTPEAVAETVGTIRDAFTKGTRVNKTTHPFAHEIKMQKDAHKLFGPTIPEILGTTKTGFVQEFAGTRLPKKYTPIGLEFAQRHLDKVSAHGGVVPLHFDLWQANILRRGAQLHIIDWGLAAKTAVTPRMISTAKEATEMYFKIQGIPVRRKILNQLQTSTTSILSTASPVTIPDQLHKEIKAITQTVSRTRKAKLNILQENAQSLPFKLNAKRTTSHGVDRTSRSK